MARLKKYLEKLSIRLPRKATTPRRYPHAFGIARARHGLALLVFQVVVQLKAIVDCRDHALFSFGSLSFRTKKAAALAAAQPRRIRNQVCRRLRFGRAIQGVNCPTTDMRGHRLVDAILRVCAPAMPGEAKTRPTKQAGSLGDVRWRDHLYLLFVGRRSQNCVMDILVRDAVITGHHVTGPTASCGLMMRSSLRHRLRRVERRKHVAAKARR
jgi:hypothetical protein